MMDDLDRSIFFNSIFLVLWAVAFVPYTIREKKYGLLLATFLPLIPFQFICLGIFVNTLSILWPGLSTRSLGWGLGVGFRMHYFNERKRKE